MTSQAELAAASCGRDLVPGDPSRLHDVATLMSSYSTDLEEAAVALATLATPAWSGAAADTFRATFTPQPDRWRTAADAFAAASQAVSTYATALVLAQDDADDALVRYRRGAAAMSHDAATGGRGGMGATMGADDPGARDRALAVIAVDDARGRVRTAGIAAHNAVRAASDGAPEGLSRWQTTAAVLTGLVVDGAELTWNTVLVPVINGVATYATAVGTNPTAAATLLGGWVLIVAGAGIDVGGAAACVTGVGCAATPAAEGAGTGMIVTGFGLGVAGAVALGGTAAANPITVVERSGDGETPPTPTALPGRPVGVGNDYVPRVGDKNTGVVWQKRGAKGKAFTVRVMDPEPRYPYGYVVFQNENGQPLQADGRTGSRGTWHFPIRADGTYDTPQGWTP